MPSSSNAFICNIKGHVSCYELSLAKDMCTKDPECFSRFDGTKEKGLLPQHCYMCGYVWT